MVNPFYVVKGTGLCSPWPEGRIALTELSWLELAGARNPKRLAQYTDWVRGSVPHHLVGHSSLLSQPQECSESSGTSFGCLVQLN